MIKVRPIYPADLEKCRELRNANRAWFSDPGIISKERHEAWYNSIKDHYFFNVIELDGVVIGTVSCKYDQGMTEIGNLTLDENYRGNGYMTEAVKGLIREDNVYFGRTLPHNIKSQKVFERLGFKRMGVEDGVVVFKLYA